VTGPDEPDLPGYDLDEALLEATLADGHARTRAIAYPQTAVVIGRGGKCDVELHRDRIEADGVPLLRRRGGGCAVVLDPGNAIVSVALPTPGTTGITRGFETISRWLIDALAELGVPGVEKRGTSDLVLGNRKIGGSCIYRRLNLLYYSTTLLVAPDPELAERYLKHPPREPDYRTGRSHRDFMGSLRDALGHDDVARFVGELRTALDEIG